MAMHSHHRPGLVVSRSRCLLRLVFQPVGDISPQTWAKTMWIHKAGHCQTSISMVLPNGAWSLGETPLHRQQDRVCKSPGTGQ